jgi:hypothetical protein
MNSFSISWFAAISPGVSLAGIPLGLSEAEFESELAMYAIDDKQTLYRFEGSPVLKMARSEGGVGECGYIFDLFESDVISLNKRGIPALTIQLRHGEVFAIKIYDFSFPGEPANDFVYKGLLHSNIGLGSVVAELMPYTSLEFDRGEGWFVTDESFGLVEVSGWGVPLEEEPLQVITAICVL